AAARIAHGKLGFEKFGFCRFDRVDLDKIVFRCAISDIVETIPYGCLLGRIKAISLVEKYDSDAVRPLGIGRAESYGIDRAGIRLLRKIGIADPHNDETQAHKNHYSLAHLGRFFVLPAGPSLEIMHGGPRPKTFR